MKRFWLLFVTSWLVMDGAAQAFEVRPFVASMVDAYGGAEAVAQLGAFRLDAEVRSEMGDVTGNEQRQYLAPDKLRVVVTWPGRTEIRILNGKRAWTGAGDQLAPASRPLLLAMVYEMLRSTVPESLLLHRKVLEDGGVQKRDGSEYRRLRLRWSQDLALTFWASTKTLRVEFVDGAVDTGEARMGFATAYLDFRRVGGLLLPFVERNYAMGELVATTRVRSFVPSPAGLGPFSPSR